MVNERPTPYRELNHVLHELATSARSILGRDFVGAYLQGSFALGDFDEHSDVDFAIVVEDEPDDGQVAALQSMHARVYGLQSSWAQHLEGSYFTRKLIKRLDPSRAEPWYLDNGSRELVPSDHCNTAVVRWCVRERGIALAGPEPRTLVDPVSGDDLRLEVSATMRWWADMIFADPREMDRWWYPSFTVLTYCRMLYTLESGMISSKPVAARWAQETLDQRWAPLIRRAWEVRPSLSSRVGRRADPDELSGTLEFIRYAVDVAALRFDGARP